MMRALKEDDTVGMRQIKKKGGRKTRIWEKRERKDVSRAM